MGYIGVIAHLLAIVGHMFTKSVHQPLGNFKSKNLSLVFSPKIPWGSSFYWDLFAGCHQHLMLQRTNLPQVAPRQAFTYLKPKQKKSWTTWRKGHQPQIVFLCDLCDGHRGDLVICKKTREHSAGLSGRVQDHPEQYCILTLRGFCSVKQSSSRCSTTQGPSSPPKGKILWKKKCTENIIPLNWFKYTARKGVYVLMYGTM